ncbi:hypothetical protein [Aquamicrobium sp.]|uniref:hypothetical protein n=1 Tax=Aquamicrobium sp. TaxID=1872579 RepID=UPI00349E73D4
MNGLVGSSFPRLEELAVSSILFGAQNVTKDLKKTSFVTGSAEIPRGVQQALGHMQAMVERDGAELLRKELHALIRSEELQIREPLGKEEETLYAMRPLKNAVQLIAWAKAQGFPSTLEDDDFHVTICYSKAKVEWDDVEPRGDTITVSGGARQIELFGKAIVLTFDSDELQARNRELRKAGASSDHPAYRPHVTISYAIEDFDFSLVEPFTGDLVFGAEKFAPVKEDWSSDIKEIRLNKAELSLAERLNNAVLGKGGKIIDIGANLTTSRLVSLGFLAEAIDAGLDTYQVNEVLDEKTCPVCRYMHGKTFRVEREYSRVLNVMATSDPKELKGLAPWPLQTKAGLKQLYSMSLGDMQSSGYGSPPYHPGCRGMLALQGSVIEEFPIGSIAIAEAATLPSKTKPTTPEPTLAWTEKPYAWLELVDKLKSQNRREAALSAWSNDDLDTVRQILVDAGLLT